jgi:hypothetical protein
VKLGMTNGEIALVAFIFGLIYLAGLLPRIASIAARLVGGDETPPSKRK